MTTMLDNSRSPPGVGHSPKVSGRQQLGDDLTGFKVADEALSPGMAEAAGQRAPHLRRYAHRAAIVLRNEDGFGLGAVFEAEQPLSRTVVGDLLAADLRAGDGKPLGKA